MSCEHAAVALGKTAAHTNSNQRPNTQLVWANGEIGQENTALERIYVCF